jgi:NRAMP (natural resistance-associated macrophage protein)-like metal ion transporter
VTARRAQAPPRKQDPPLKVLAQLGPGLITGAADDDPSGIATYAQAGARFGYGMQWTLIAAYPLMVAIQLVSAYLGRTTGEGLACNMRKVLPAWLVGALVWLLFAANVVNIGADLAAMGAASELVTGVGRGWLTIAFAALSLLCQIFVDYGRYTRILKWLTTALFVYVAVLFTVDIDWSLLARRLLWPALPLNHQSVTFIVAILGTTISPYMFFWQNAQEVEEIEVDPAAHSLRKAPPQDAQPQFTRIRRDTLLGMAVSNVIGIAIMICTAATLHQHGSANITSAADAAKALEPLAGQFASIIFALGIVGTGLLAVPVLAGSSAYAIGEFRGWKCGLRYRPRQAVRFYAVVSSAMLLGLAMNGLGINPFKALIASAVINGVIAAPIMAAMMFVATRKSVMGRYPISRPLTLMGWLAAAIMAVAALGMLLLLA